MTSIVGHHLIADLRVRNPSVLKRVEDLQPFFEQSIKVADLSVLGRQFKQFEPHGATGLYLLSESHVAFHTWPEHGLICVDVFTCSTENKAQRFMDALIAQVKPIAVEKSQLLRGKVVTRETIPISVKEFSP